MKTEGLTFFEAIKLAEKGCEIERAGWSRPLCLRDDHLEYRGGSVASLDTSSCMANDWRVTPLPKPEMPLPEPETPKQYTMCFADAYGLLKLGRCVRRLCWQSEEEFIQLVADSLVNHYGDVTKFSLEDIEAGDWAVFDTPVPASPKTMTFMEAVECVNNGMAVRRLEWFNKEYRLVKDAACVLCNQRDMHPHVFKTYDVLGEDWVVFDENKRK